ncbi:MAG: phage holin family protein, partial [Limisphaerales bacterium]
ANHRSEGFFTLVGDLQDDVKSLIKKEIDLAKTEMGEKFSALGKNAGLAAAGGVLALIAFFMLLLGIGAIIANLLQKAGLSPGAAYFVSYMGLALVLGGVGYALIHKAMNAFSKISLSPEKALAGAKGAEPVPIEIRKAIDNKQAEAKEPKRSSDELQTEVIAARTRMDSEMSELKSRLTPGYMIRSLFAGIKHHPTRVILISASTGLGGYLYWRNRHMVEVKRLEAQRKWWQFRTRHA